MRKLILGIALLMGCAASQKSFAQTEGKYFNSLAIGVSAGTTGIGVDLAAPIGAHFALRAGLDFMPNFTLNEDVDVTGTNNGYNYYGEVEVEGSIKRTQGSVLLNIYPSKHSSFFVCGGAFFGGDKMITIQGHSDELQQLIAQGQSLGIEIGDYTIPVDKNGNVSGGLKVASFRPYVGIGFGRAVPRKRIGFMYELGVQFHKTPEVYTDNGNLGTLVEEADNDFTDIINKFTVYPVMKFRLSGRLF
jgi:hypothetical protein